MKPASQSQSTIELSQQVFDARYFSFSRLGKPSTGPVDLFFGGFEHCSEDYTINRKGFPVYLLEFVEEGTGTMTLQEEEHTLRKGSLYVYGPGSPCRIMNSKERPMVKYFFAFHCSPGTMRKCYHFDHLFLGPEDGGELLGDLVRILFAEGLAAHEDSYKICSYYLDILLMRMSRGRLAKQHHREHAYQVFKDVKEHIEDNYLELRKMEDIARQVGLNSSYISRLFKRYYHMTPYNFLLKMKMGHALDMLRQGHITVQAVSHAVGYDDPFHFSRVFKKFKGISPSQIRNTGI